ncbi:iron-sulfur cluster biosynthesis family protein [Enterococcus lemanii]|uniref:Iron-sulfur cluster biosynthesis family protein n=1 Tax=Enterococcus lemanii TaxID=1159752 RepID=A0ABV9MX22_9ENTE|nr:iron-sulfur cluster biosynthesis family protein [Enterococcus lemanii]MBM7708578.1 uncharacterized protein YqkB [Enterococcus lemanii]
MKLSFSQAAQDVILAKQQPGDVILLDYEDAIGPFTQSAVSCQLYPSFRLLLVPKEFPKEQLIDYDDAIETELGIVSVKKRSEMLLDEAIEIMVEPAYQRLQIRSNSGVIAANMPLLRMDA